MGGDGCGAASIGSLILAWGCTGQTEWEEAPDIRNEAEARRQKVTVDKGDLDFILRQIEIAEAHAAGTPLQSLILSPQLHYGLRTVDGSHNNIIPGQEEFGAADRVFPRLTAPHFRPGENVSIDLDGPGPMAVGDPTSYLQTSGFVFDSQVRTISNLIVDQTADNPAAVAAAARTEDSEADIDGRGTFFIPNVAPDEGLSAPFNAWFTFFGQFFDHGLDLVEKGGSGTVFIPLQPDDPLYVPGGSSNFMVLDRATNRAGPDGVLGTADDVREHLNHTTPWVDQNQTYTSHASHQVFLREYVMDASGRPVSTGRLLNGARGGLPSWSEVKAQARTLLGIELSDPDVLRVPLLATDEYGKFLRGPSGFPQLVTPTGLIEGNPGSPVSASLAFDTGHQFLDDIAHAAVPGPGLLPDPDTVVGGPQTPGTYDDELLDTHFCTGDGRGNENIGLTAVHFVFHSEHNRLTDHIKELVVATANPNYIAQWLLPGADQSDGIQELEWNGERIFQAARFGTEMQYQHLVFEEFARKVQPEVNVFGSYDTAIDPAIFAEFAHTVYRFGHSMLTETIARTRADGTGDEISLIDAFINPPAFTASGVDDRDAVANIVRGTTRQVGNEVDEFVTSALRNNLLGLPLDLAAINLARGRDVGVPPLNEARRLFFNATHNSALMPYTSWLDYSFALRNPESLVNFVAAYGTHPTITAETTLAGKRAAAAAIVNGEGTPPPDAWDFLNATGLWAAVETGINDVDFWVGGIAEKQMIFGGLLGPTFNFVFETLLERLQDGDRFYYLLRTVNLNFLTQLEENTFAEMIMRATGVKNLPGDVFSRPAYVFDLENLGTSGRIVDDPNTEYDESTLLIRMPDGTVRYTGKEHIVMGGTDGDDRMWGSEGDDTFWGGPGNDRIEGGDGNDFIHGGEGDDIITDLFGIDNIKGGPGNDVISAGPGNGDLILAGGGHDFVVAGSDPKEVFGGHGNDFLYGGDAADIIFGGEGDDWIEGGEQDDLLQGDNGDPFQISPIVGNDVIIGGGGNDDYDAESGDDIMVSDQGTERHEGMLGFDWVIYKGSPIPADADLNRTVFAAPDVEDLRDRFDMVEGLSGWIFDDILTGDDETSEELLQVDEATGFNNALNTPEQIALIDGLQQILGPGVTSFSGGNIILGGPGNDRIEGRGGDDIIDGDAWLNVRIRIVDANENEIGWADTMKAVIQDKSGQLAGTRADLTLAQAMFAGILNPGQLRIVREIIFSPPGNYVDTAVYSDSIAAYDILVGADGAIRVSHTRGTQTDGTDILRNIEVLQFADGSISTSIIGVDVTPPAPVFGLTARGGSELVNLSWVTPFDAVAVTVLRSEVGFAAGPMDRVGQVVAFEGLATGFSDTGLENGTTYFYTVFARDLAGNHSTPAQAIAVPEIDQAPRVSIISPISGSAFPRGEQVRVTASASDDRGISHVEFYRDGVIVHVDTSAPYEADIEVQRGQNSVTAVAVDVGGNRASASVILCGSIIGICEPLPPADLPPRVAILFPSAGSIIPAGNQVDIQADAVDEESGLVVEFYVNGALVRRDTSAPYHAMWRAERPGRYQITALAIDRTGQRNWHTVEVEVR